MNKLIGQIRIVLSFLAEFLPIILIATTVLVIRNFLRDPENWSSWNWWQWLAATFAVGCILALIKIVFFPFPKYATNFDASLKSVMFRMIFRLLLYLIVACAFIFVELTKN
jgi:hypothetical protein